MRHAGPRSRQASHVTLPSLLTNQVASTVGGLCTGHRRRFSWKPCSYHTSPRSNIHSFIHSSSGRARCLVARNPYVQKQQISSHSREDPSMHAKRYFIKLSSEVHDVNDSTHRTFIVFARSS